MEHLETECVVDVLEVFPGVIWGSFFIFFGYESERPGFIQGAKQRAEKQAADRECGEDGAKFPVGQERQASVPSQRPTNPL